MSDSRLKTVGVFNPGVALLGDEIILLLRVAEEHVETGDRFVYSPRLVPGGNKLDYEFTKIERPAAETNLSHFETSGHRTVLPHISHFQIARLDRTGTEVMSVETHPDLFGQGENEVFGIEDPRITQIGDTYYITYVCVSDRMNISTALMSTTDFRSFTRHGIIFPCENKDAIIHPQKFSGKYICYHRPVADMSFCNPSMVIGYSPDLIHWGEHKLFMAPGTTWDRARIGGGTVPLKTEKGWLQLYHGVEKLESGQSRYSAGAVLTSLDDPATILARSENPVMQPELDYETKGYVSNVVFPTGWVPDPSDADRVLIFYGCADEYVAVTSISVTEILASVRPE